MGVMNRMALQVCSFTLEARRSNICIVRMNHIWFPLDPLAVVTRSETVAEAVFADAATDAVPGRDSPLIPLNITAPV